MSLRVIPLFATVLLLVSPGVGVKMAGAQEGVSDSDRSAIRQVIENQLAAFQLAAFQHDDGGEAFSYASPGIQRRFGTPDTFMAMVRNGYAAVYRPREVEIRGLRVEGGTIQQEVLFVGPDGKPVIAVYTMQRQADGSWKINGVYLIAAPDATT